jgi:hypothetical protein
VNKGIKKEFLNICHNWLQLGGKKTKKKKKLHKHSKLEGSEIENYRL